MSEGEKEESKDVVGVRSAVQMPVEVTWLPPADGYGTPERKMPRCPQCEADEVGMISTHGAICYGCGTRYRRAFDANGRPATESTGDSAAHEGGRPPNPVQGSI